MSPDPWWTLLLALLFSAPWLVAIVYFGRDLRGTDAPSQAEMVRQRLWH